ncbi:hypothetical protein LTR08_002534 [Meristemomyces frigidus]|nr:hypothetical protein LTR08_002534 [Meristemomyces frigidus]
MKESSSHIPTLTTHDQRPPSEALHIIFLQRLPEATRTEILNSLRTNDPETVAWSKQFAPDNTPQPRALIPMPWIRDWWATSPVILEICAQGQRNNRFPPGHEYTSFVLVDSGWDAGTVIAAHWTAGTEGVGDGEGLAARLEAVRVPVGIANMLLTLLDKGSVRDFADVLGEEAYEDAKVDFYQDLPVREAGLAAGPEKAYQPPSFLPKDLCSSASTLYVLSLVELEPSAVSALKAEILHGDGTTDERPDVRIIPWQGPMPTRSDLAIIFDWIMANSSPSMSHSCAFFVDYMLQRPDGRPQIIASYYTRGHRADVPDQARLVPVDAECVIEYWRAACTHAAENEINFDLDGDIWRKEVVVDIGKELGFGNGRIECCPVFFLRRFTLDEERRIRTALSRYEDWEANDAGGKEFFYAGYLWPATDSATHTLEELRDLFERSDPNSPFFSPSHSSSGELRLTNYPSDFIALDDRALDAEGPRVIVASCLDFGYELGWEYGVTSAVEAYVAWVNLDVANMGLQELVEADEVGRLWLSDVKAYAAEDWVESITELDGEEEDGEEEDGEEDDGEDDDDSDQGP